MTPATTQALNDILTQEAEGTALDALSRLYGVPRIPIISQEYWRRVLLAAAFGPRDTFGVLFEVLEAIFDFWADPILTFDIDMDNATPGQLASTAGPVWNCTHTNRLVRVADVGLYWVKSVSGGGTLLDLEPFAGPYWDSGDWSGEVFSAQATILPFWFREEFGTTTVYLDAELLGVPPTYLRTDGLDVRGLEPYGGEVLTSAGFLGNNPSTAVLEHVPIYLPGDGLGGAIARLLNNLCASGFRVVLTSLEWCSTSTLGIGSLGDLASYGSPGANHGPFVVPVNFV